MIAYGWVTSARPAYIEACLPAAALGAGVRIECARGPLFGSVAAICDRTITISPHGVTEGVVPGDVVCTDRSALEGPLGLCALGRSFDAAGNAIDGKPPARYARDRAEITPPAPQERRPIAEPFWTGVTAIDALLTVGTGARIGIFGPPGSGKSSLLHALVYGAEADAVVVGLIGERGREAEEWVRKSTPRTTIYCATGGRPAAERIHAASLALAQAHALRSRGLSVLLIVDSFARLAAAHREIATACGETAGRAGYPPRVFAELAAYAEVAGSFANGSITLVATVLEDGDDRDPVSEAARALLDGHIALSTHLAQTGKFPAIDVLRSRSRTMHGVVAARHRLDAAAVRGALAALEETRDARALGIAASADTERAKELEGAFAAFLHDARVHSPGETVRALHSIAELVKKTTQ